ncbi:DUF4879 domain-containing protein [Idiomarina sp.]|uniref:DUF4879 domain-containing protein n=1 Tax=Alteromonadales TaxID=135622 RepID=UPI0026280681|nr:DUF4879 domain-containing protein [Idiomarina sp.]
MWTSQTFIAVLICAFTAAYTSGVVADDSIKALQAQNNFSKGSIPIPDAVTDKVTPYDTAPALSALYVYGIYSSDCGIEYTAGQSTTSCDHGGTVLQSAVLEIGYGGNPIVWMNGGTLPSSASLGSTPVCITGSSYSWPCNAGQTIVGFLREYDLSGSQNGIFRYQNTSLNSPFNTLSVQISIL